MILCFVCLFSFKGGWAGSPLLWKKSNSRGIAMASELVESISCASAGSFEHVHADFSIQQPSERDVDPWSGDSAVDVDSEFGAAGLTEFSDVIPVFDANTHHS